MRYHCKIDITDCLNNFLYVIDEKFDDFMDDVESEVETFNRGIKTRIQIN
ncbi:hypothetical protein [Candidatus Phytoplasma sp. AldY-WA1]|nr:hypothetical protein [Candidatus Phytoplasma sp. AldY-WA1]